MFKKDSKRDANSPDNKKEPFRRDTVMDKDYTSAVGIFLDMAGHDYKQNNLTVFQGRGILLNEARPKTIYHISQHLAPLSEFVKTKICPVMSKFAQEALEEHNKCRKKHGVDKLTLNWELCAQADKWAKHLIRLVLFGPGCQKVVNCVIELCYQPVLLSRAVERGLSGSCAVTLFKAAIPGHERSGEFKHSNAKYQGKPLGENVASKLNSGGAVPEYKGEEVTEQWYSEIKDFTFGSSDHDLKAGHFSQVVWKESREFGIGVASKAGRCVVVANYFPAGNYRGQYKDNVPPLTTGSKLKGLFTKSKTSGNKDSNSSSSDDDERNNNQRKAAAGRKVTPAVATAGNYTRKVTTTRTIRKPDGTVETITEERVEEVPPDSTVSKLDKDFKNKADLGFTRPTVSSQSSKEFSEDALIAHNKFRSKHGSPALGLNKDLCKTAQKWADHLASISTLQHSNSKDRGEQLGENIASKWGSNGADYTGEEAVGQWYSEEPTYDYSGRSNAGSAGHFSQVVWKGSRELGIGKAKDGKGRVYVVANYKPAGNFIGQFAENVTRPR